MVVVRVRRVAVPNWLQGSANVFLESGVVVFVSRSPDMFWSACGAGESDIGGCGGREKGGGSQ